MNDPTPRRPPLVLEGDCTLTETEGGFFPLQFTINDSSVAMALAHHVGAAWTGENRGRPSALREDTATLGRVRMTVEFLGES